VGRRRKPGNIIYSSDGLWHTKSPPLPLAARHPLCKCAKDVLLSQESAKSEENCEKCCRKSIRDAQTSPKNSPIMSPISPKILTKKQLLSPSKKVLESSPSHSITTRGTLEKSNSLGESKPNKQLRTTKSLSPRPPVKHQPAVPHGSDENSVLVKVSPADDTMQYETKPLLSEKNNKIVENLRLDDWQKNKSTSCLVYVPVDPWTKMETNNQASEQQQQKGKKGSNRMKKLMDVKSLSKPDLVDNPLNDDPWVFDASRISRDARKASTLHIDSKSQQRPLRRSKSPHDELSKNSMSSFSPKLGCHSVPEKTLKKSNTGRSNSKSSNNNHQQFLNVSNPNLLQQPRHSFSTSPTTLSTSNNTKDDELTLNIRRLSEQIKYSSTYSSYGNFNVTTDTPSVSTSPKQTEGIEKSATLLSDSLLETTC
jgi:hypothetical protein